jgi:hypothetical protein
VLLIGAFPQLPVPGPSVAPYESDGLGALSAVATADSAYASSKLLERWRKLSTTKPITFVVSRPRLDAAALYEPAPPAPRRGQIGRPRLKKGERLPDLSVAAEEPKTVWEPTKIANCYGSAERTVEIASARTVWYSRGLFAVPVRWVSMRDPQKEFETQALSCTDLDADPLRRSSLGSCCAGGRR